MRRKRLGQHYLVDKEAVRRIVDAAEIRPDDRILEVGTGRGVLTKELVGLGRSFQGYEIDEENYRETLAAVSRARDNIHLGDAFEQRLEFDVLVASLPYSESATFVEWLSTIDYDRAVVLLQEDFVDKLLAAPGTRDYRAVSATAQISAEVRVIGRVGRASFHPQPRVNSVLVSFKKKMRITQGEVSRIKRLFSLRRRRVASALASLEMDTRKDYGPRRVFALPPEEVHLLCLSDAAA
jgi:16S rRNA (adenine1518-N6/adenine1519-N6)-dimethyltransferase